jgi:hypothetical protein
MSTSLSKRQTVDELVRAWNLAMHELKTGLAAIERAQEHLKAFDTSGSSYDLLAFSHQDTTTDFSKKQKRMKAAAWRYLIDRIEIKKLASIARAKEIDKQLHERPDTLPEITMDNIFGWLQSMDEQAKEFMQEAVLEVYKNLRPSALNRHKTNSAFRIGRKVILCGRIAPCYSGKNRFRANYHYQDELRALDNVFHLLDGRALSAYRGGDLLQQIETVEGPIGETEFFRYKCYGNGNLHLEFRRMDLVQQINSIGGTGLPDPNQL